MLAETFIDGARFAGTCYRAAGWIPLGETRGFGQRRHGYCSHGHPMAGAENIAAALCACGRQERRALRLLGIAAA